MEGFSDRTVEVGHLYGLRWFHYDTDTGHGIDEMRARTDGSREYICRCGQAWRTYDDGDEGYGWDAWEAVHARVTSAGPVLSGAYAGTWEPGENVATCRFKDRIHHEVPVHPQDAPVPHRRCKCGFWAYWSLGDKLVDLPTVVGLVKGYGNIVQGPHGFRASHASIEALFLHVWDDAVALALEERYAPVYSQFGAMLLMHKPPAGQPRLGDNYFPRHPHDHGRDHLTVPRTSFRTAGAARTAAALKAAAVPCGGCGAQTCAPGQALCLSCQILNTTVVLRPAEPYTFPSGGFIGGSGDTAPLNPYAVAQRCGRCGLTGTHVCQ